MNAAPTTPFNINLGGGAGLMATPTVPAAAPTLSATTPANPAAEQLKLHFRGQGYDEQTSGEIAGAVMTLAKHGLLGLGPMLGLGGLGGGAAGLGALSGLLGGGVASVQQQQQQPQQTSGAGGGDLSALVQSALNGGGGG